MKKLNHTQIQQSLKEKFYAGIPFPLKSCDVDQAVQAFFRFLEEPEEVKNHIDFRIALKHRRGDVGFKSRKAEDDIYNDNKEFFHFHPAIFEKYQDFLEKNPAVHDFCLKANPIWDLVYQTTHAILEGFSPQHPNVVSKIFDTQHPHILLRFLKYSWQESGKYLAKSHFDSGSFTLAIAESNPGLRIGSCPDDLNLVQHKPNQALFMISSNYRNVMDTEEFRPGWHDVIQLDETLIGQPFARWAVVAFIEAHGVEALPRTETHKWYKNV